MWWLVLGGYEFLMQNCEGPFSFLFFWEEGADMMKTLLGTGSAYSVGVLVRSLSRPYCSMVSLTGFSRGAYTARR